MAGAVPSTVVVCAGATAGTVVVGGASSPWTRAPIMIATTTVSANVTRRMAPAL